MPNATVRAAAIGLPASTPTRSRKVDRSKRDLPFQGIDVSALPERYAMKLNGVCLEPEIAHGAFVEFSKTEAPQVGDYVILFKRLELLQPGEPQCYIKRLVMSIPDWIQFPWTDHPQSTAKPLVMFAQINPPRTFKALCSTFAAVHKMVGVLTPEQVRWP